jgi:hypothetical protein
MGFHLKEEIRKRFEYCDGKVLVKTSGQWRGIVGEEAGSVRKDGRRIIQIKGKRLFTHQVVWLLFNDELPLGSIDHIDNDQTNNKIENLRAASGSEQQGNKSVQTNNTSGFKGVSFSSKRNNSRPWRAYIKDNGVSVHLGYFISAEEAARAYDTAAKEKFGAFALLNFKE